MRVLYLLALTFWLGALCLSAQSMGNAGSVEGTVTDPSGAVVPDAMVTITNAVSGFKQTVTTGMDGSFRLVNVPQSPYHLEVMAAGFGTLVQDVSVRNAIPMQLKLKLTLARGQSSVTVEAAGADILENYPPPRHRQSVSPRGAREVYSVTRNFKPDQPSGAV